MHTLQPKIKHESIWGIVIFLIFEVYNLHLGVRIRASTL